jgi:hypothetical protein
VPDAGKKYKGAATVGVPARLSFPASDARKNSQDDLDTSANLVRQLATIQIWSAESFSGLDKIFRPRRDLIVRVRIDTRSSPIFQHRRALLT